MIVLAMSLLVSTATIQNFEFPLTICKGSECFTPSPDNYTECHGDICVYKSSEGETKTSEAQRVCSLHAKHFSGGAFAGYEYEWRDCSIITKRINEERNNYEAEVLRKQKELVTCVAQGRCR